MKKYNFGKNIKQVRTALKLSQQEFAKKLNVSRSCVNHWENNESLPNLYVLKLMNEVFGVDYNEIIDGI